MILLLLAILGVSLISMVILIRFAQEARRIEARIGASPIARFLQRL